MNDVDWDAGVRYERREEAELFALLVLSVGALVVVRYDPTDPDDHWAISVAVGGLAALPVGAAICFWWSRRSGRSDRYRCVHAIRSGLDPGAGLRSRTERLARGYAADRWLAWLTALVFASQAVLGHWQHLAVTVPAAIVFLVGLGIATWRRQWLAVAAKRWLDDPPVPASERA
ncbi:hypothetical protein [Blastococcus brunescens]|uniref:Integral membrane protein n=1 Tax=Blastococcus brunescens TaxID=1564165 RepID=A0ABZ1B5Z0_9ACTN|nr:hypothetical protein [Blastococcus sp. BMG 8361]WRL66230.1 hypothetical protein U6N30_12595 [Blastococcus sp. BMG 8361]